MKFYNQQQKYYCGIDLHAKKMFVCILDQKGKVKVHQNINTDPELFFELIFFYLDDVVVGVECVFCPALQAGSTTGRGLPTFVSNTIFRLSLTMHYT